MIHEILPRHFVQTAAKGGIPASVVQTIFDELLQAAEVVEPVGVSFGLADFDH